MDTTNIISDAVLDGLAADQLNDLINRLYSARGRLNSGDIAPKLAELLQREQITDARRLELGTWDWDNGFFPYFDDVAVLLGDGRRVGIEIDEHDRDQELAGLINTEAVSFGLGETSRITVDVASGRVSVE